MAPIDPGSPPRRPPPVPPWLGRALCRLGFHDYHVLEVSFGFGPGETIEKVECRRCRSIGVRKAR